MRDKNFLKIGHFIKNIFIYPNSVWLVDDTLYNNSILIISK